LLGSTDANPVKRKLPDYSKLKPLFRLPKNLQTNMAPGSQEVFPVEKHFRSRGISGPALFESGERTRQTRA
jgi:hypothetical protein